MLRGKLRLKNVTNFLVGVPVLYHMNNVWYQTKLSGESTVDEQAARTIDHKTLHKLSLFELVIIDDVDGTEYPVKATQWLNAMVGETHKNREIGPSSYELMEFEGFKYAKLVQATKLHNREVSDALFAAYEYGYRQAKEGHVPLTRAKALKAIIK